MARAAKGHVERLPSGSYRVLVYVGVDPLTRQEIRFRSTAKDERLAQVELGRLLKEASEGRTPEADAIVARLLDEYAAVAEWDVTTRQTNEGFIRRTIKPALGHDELLVAGNRAVAEVMLDGAVHALAAQRGIKTLAPSATAPTAKRFAALAAGLGLRSPDLAARSPTGHRASSESYDSK